MCDGGGGAGGQGAGGGASGRWPGERAGAEDVRVVHSFVRDGDPERDFLAWLGLRAEVPMLGEPHDRHIRHIRHLCHLCNICPHPSRRARRRFPHRGGAQHHRLGRDPGEHFRRA
jgi:hypothetical protein